MVLQDVSSPPRQGLTRDQAFDLAVALHRQGRLGEAERVYRGILQLRPIHFGCLNYLGAICNDRGRPEEVVRLPRGACKRRLQCLDGFWILKEKRNT